MKTIVLHDAARGVRAAMAPATQPLHCAAASAAARTDALCHMEVIECEGRDILKRDSRHVKTLSKHTKSGFKIKASFAPHDFFLLENVF